LPGAVRKTAGHIWSYLKSRPLFVLSLLVIAVLGIRELTDSSGLSAEDKRILADRYATATSQAVVRATVQAIEPILEDHGVGDYETTPVTYPGVPWTIGWFYNCGPGLPHALFTLTLYDATDTTYTHGIVVGRARGSSGAGSTPQEPSPERTGREFVLDTVTRCAWRIKVMRGVRSVAGTLPKPDHT
jgi:hypothetical protein